MGSCCSVASPASPASPAAPAAQLPVATGRSAFRADHSVCSCVVEIALARLYGDRTTEHFQGFVESLWVSQVSWLGANDTLSHTSCKVSS